MLFSVNKDWVRAGGQFFFDSDELIGCLTCFFTLSLSIRFFEYEISAEVLVIIEREQRCFFSNSLRSLHSLSMVSILTFIFIGGRQAMCKQCGVSIPYSLNRCRKD